jgi:hypothetical protein
MERRHPRTLGQGQEGINAKAGLLGGAKAIMMKYKAQFAAALIGICLASCREGGGVATDAADKVPPSQSTVVSAADLHKLYDDKTWLWADGAGFFAKSGDFTAWTGSGDKASYATGFWWVNDQGAICFDGTWRTKEGANSAITCFSHRTDGRVLYQRRNPSGAWYVFKSDPVKSGDEFEKLKAGDQVKAQLETVRTEVGASAP